MFSVRVRSCSCLCSARSASFCRFRIRAMIFAGMLVRFLTYPSSTIIWRPSANTKNNRTPVVSPRASKSPLPRGLEIGPRRLLPCVSSTSSRASASASASSESPLRNTSSVVPFVTLSERTVQHIPDYTSHGIPRQGKASPPDGCTSVLAPSPDRSPPMSLARCGPGIRQRTTCREVAPSVSRARRPRGRTASSSSATHARRTPARARRVGPPATGAAPVGVPEGVYFQVIGGPIRTGLAGSPASASARSRRIRTDQARSHLQPARSPGVVVDDVNLTGAAAPVASCPIARQA